MTDKMKGPTSIRIDLSGSQFDGLPPTARVHCEMTPSSGDWGSKFVSVTLSLSGGTQTLSELIADVSASLSASCDLY